MMGFKLWLCVGALVALPTCFCAEATPVATEWQFTRQRGTSSGDGAWAIAVDSSDNIWITGYTESASDGQTSTGDYDIFLVKYSSSGEWQFTQQHGTGNVCSANGCVSLGPSPDTEKKQVFLK